LKSVEVKGVDYAECLGDSTFTSSVWANENIVFVDVYFTIDDWPKILDMQSCFHRLKISENNLIA
jgi:hypothetical protein